MGKKLRSNRLKRTRPMERLMGKPTIRIFIWGTVLATMPRH
jgi:hypothetical protein